MPAASLGSIDEILAAARQRRALSGGADSPPVDNQLRSALLAAVATLRQEVAQALGPKLGGVRLQLDPLAALVSPQASIGKPTEIWRVLDELEDQLEALLR